MCGDRHRLVGHPRQGIQHAALQAPGWSS
jgi:hypothetical protein